MILLGRIGLSGTLYLVGIAPRGTSKVSDSVSHLLFSACMGANHNPEGGGGWT